MQNISQRTNPVPPAASENANAKPSVQVDGAIREFGRQDVEHLGREPENTTEVVTDINSLVQQFAGASLAELQNVILDLQHLHDFLHGEGERIQREVSTYMQLSQTAMGSTRIIAKNIVHWREVAEGTAHALEKRRAESERTNAKGPVATDDVTKGSLHDNVQSAAKSGTGRIKQSATTPN